MTDWLIFAATGAFAGLLAGLFGVGGGLIMVPILALLLPHLGVAEAVTMQVAIGTSLAVISFTSLSSAAAHQRRGGVDGPVLLRLTPGLLLGAWIGAEVADHLSGALLRNIVGTGALLVAAQMAVGRQPTTHHDAARPGPGTPELFGAGTVIGAAAALIGIGGGSLSVPYLSLRGLTIHRAVGTAAAAGIPIAWGGAFGFIWNGWSVPGIPSPSLGYVLLPALVGIGLFSIATAPLGARLAHAARPETLKRAFALLLLVIGLHLLLT
ncbi:sulfite exporter TauE/SafE family protein [Flagellatimonas centrodinii]|uniref:sulfite exporter TauE/SafE family protein n=1 Tax=Flagellatimonas centrodinii TaxID=2806210 RepID=UPI001FEE0B51|nr:sulfite exporter TauE/SafE family protein [Flagellatimonas centrodinii]ULQ45107.1 sulfite exporter TauE/SafE family protein [Flagellatimonas centrodinii]